MSLRYPLMLDLRGQRCVVVGGGQVAARKVARLAECGAEISIIAPSICRELQDFSAKGRVSVIERPYQDGDLTGAALAFAATDRREVNAAVLAEGRRLGIPVNVADDPVGSGFQVPALLERGGLQIAISTGGRSPAFARRMREQLGHWLTPERLELMELYAELRGSLAEQQLASDGSAWTTVDERALDLLREGRRAEAGQLLREQVLAAAGRKA